MPFPYDLVTSKPREESGSKTSRKYTFQSDFSLFLLLRRHEGAQDYVYLFDYHEDLLVLNSADNPEKLDFYQIKSKDKGNWTIKELIKSETDLKTKKPKLSIIGKLYLNKLNFPDNTQNLIFVSNAPFSFKDLEGKSTTTKSSIKASELDSTELDVCVQKIKQEHSIDDLKDFTNITGFKVTKLSNTDSSTHCLGELTRLMNILNPNHKINCQLAYNQIIGEVRRKSNTTTSQKNLKDLRELIENKGISRKQFLEYLDRAGLYKSVEDDWSEIKSELMNCGVIGTIELSKYRKSFRDVSMQLINDVHKIPLKNLKNEIENTLVNGEALKSVTSTSTLIEIVNYVECRLRDKFFEEYFIKCLIIKIIHERHRY